MTFCVKRKYALSCLNAAIEVSGSNYEQISLRIKVYAV